MALGPESDEAPRFWARDFETREAKVGAAAGGGGVPVAAGGLAEVDDPEPEGVGAEDSGRDPELFLFLSNLRRICRNMSSDRTTKIERICKEK